MTKQEIIQEFKSKGYNLQMIGEDAYLSQGVETFVIKKNNSISVSNPAGNFKYSSYANFLNQNPFYANKLNVRD